MPQTTPKINFDDYLPKKFFSEEQLWKLLRKAHKDGWNGEINGQLSYYAEDEHFWGEHIFSSRKGEWGGSVTAKSKQFQIIKAMKKFYEKS